MRLYQAVVVNRTDENDRHTWFVVAKDLSDAVNQVKPQIQNVPDETYDLEELKFIAKEGANLIVSSEFTYAPL